MKILFYYPSNLSSVSLETLMIAFQNQGHEVHLLTLSPEGDLHRNVRKHGVIVHCNLVGAKNRLVYYVKQIIFLLRFLKKNRIQLVYSHLQHANLIAVFAQLFSGARFILCRHHSDCAYVDDNRKERLADVIINRLGKEFLVPSDKVLLQMTDVEGVAKEKIHHIRYAYDFSLYPSPDPLVVAALRDKFRARLVLVKVARLIPEKRHQVLFNAVRKLIERGLDIKLLVLSEGPEWERLEAYIRKYNMQNNIFMLGYQKNVIDYLAAADLVVHVSISEASSSLIKEAGLIQKPVLVCRGVGDFDEYIKNEVNGFVLSSANIEEECAQILERVYYNLSLLTGLGLHLGNKVLETFSVQNIVGQYEKLNKP